MPWLCPKHGYKDFRSIYYCQEVCEYWNHVEAYCRLKEMLYEERKKEREKRDHKVLLLN